MRPVTIEDGRVVEHRPASANYVHSRPFTDEEAAAYFRANPKLQTTGWEAHLLRRLATVEAERDRLLRFVTEENAVIARSTETREHGHVTLYRMPWSRSWFDTPEAAVENWLRGAPSTGGTP